MNDLPGGSIPISRAAICPDCQVFFRVEDRACPKCASTQWAVFTPPRISELVQTMRELLFKQRDLLDQAEGVLKTIRGRLHGSSSLLAGAMAKRIQTHREADGQPAPKASSARAAGGVQ